LWVQNKYSPQRHKEHREYSIFPGRETAARESYLSLHGYTMKLVVPEKSPTNVATKRQAKQEQNHTMSKGQKNYPIVVSRSGKL
jgi:hypothetical protein